MRDVRQCGVNLNYWWPIAHTKTFFRSGLHAARLGPVEVIVVRSTSGEYRVFEDACPHKRVRLSQFGRRHGDKVTCDYHGWTFSGESGACTSLGEMPGRQEKFCLKSYPVKCYAGWIWAFLGESSLAEQVPLPVIAPDNELPRYHPIPMEGTVNCHFTYITENATDLFHANLHQAQQPWANPLLESIDHDDRTVTAIYEVETPNPLAALFSRSKRTRVHVRYEYPYIHLYQEDGNFYLFVVYLPVGPQDTYVHSTFYFRKPPGTRLLLKLLHPILKYGTFQKVFRQDIRAVEEEQRAYNLAGHDAGLDTNPVTHAVRQVILKQTEGQTALVAEPQILRPGCPV
jgi:renierapurpurin 18,18'-hydroxylase